MNFGLTFLKENGKPSILFLQIISGILWIHLTTSWGLQKGGVCTSLSSPDTDSEFIINHFFHLLNKNTPVGSKRSGDPKLDADETNHLLKSMLI